MAVPRGVLALLLVSGCALLGRNAGPAIEFESLVPDPPGPRVARSTPIRWTASATGGVGERTYEFRRSRGSQEVVEQTGVRSTWSWIPERPGTFRVKVTVRDASGASVESGWSPPYVILPSVTRDTPIAVLPIENLSGERAPVQLAAQLLRTRLEQDGFHLVDEEVLEAFMHHERIRAASGLNREESRQLEAVTGAGAVLVTSLATYRERPPPQVSLFSRLVSSGEQSEILWMGSVGLSGEDAVGLLGLGRIEEPRVLLEKVVHRLTGSLARYMPEVGSGPPLPDAPQTDEQNQDDGAPAPEGLHSPGEPSARYEPRNVFRSSFADLQRKHSVAVIPFVNLSARRNAGKIMSLHFVEELSRVDSLRVVEPGLVRAEMLRYRTIIPEGPSLATAGLLSSDQSLGADLLLSGTVFDYGGPGTPTVDFDLQIIDAPSREVVWTSRSQNDGGEGVFFLDVGRVYTPYRLAREMARAAVGQMREAPRSP